MDIHVRQGVVIPEAELSMRFTPSGGPGGQHANKSNTRVELVWDLAGTTALREADRLYLLEKLGPVVRVVVDDERSQLRNRDIAHERLRVRVESALHRPKARRKTRPSRSSQRRRVEAKRQRSQTKAQRQRPKHDD